MIGIVISNSNFPQTLNMLEELTNQINPALNFSIFHINSNEPPTTLPKILDKAKCETGSNLTLLNYKMLGEWIVISLTIGSMDANKRVRKFNTLLYDRNSLGTEHFTFFFSYSSHSVLLDILAILDNFKLIVRKVLSSKFCE